MPTYEYKCRQCESRLEAVQSFTDSPLTECPSCGGALRKLFSTVGVVFKGSGFYRNDSRPASRDSKSEDSKAAASTKTDAAATSDGKSEGSSSSGSSSSGSADSKTDTKPAAKPESKPATPPSSRIQPSTASKSA